MRASIFCQTASMRLETHSCKARGQTRCLQGAPTHRGQPLYTLKASKRRYASDAARSTRQLEHVAVLGGGISGLTAAFYLRRKYPGTRITLLEGSERLGGWIQSQKVDLGPEYGQALLEAGPRTLRPISKPLLELIHLAGLEGRLILTPKTAPAATNRYICLNAPDGSGLKVLPSSPWNVFRSPFFLTLLRSILVERYWPANRPLPVPVSNDEKASLHSQMKVYDDESVDSFLSRRFGVKVARLFGSALVHGIYAADSRRLSVRSAFPSLWDAEDRGKGSVITGILRRKPSTTTSISETFDTGELVERLAGTSVFSFDEGMAALPATLSAQIAPSVDIRLSTEVVSLEPQAGGMELRLGDGTSLSASHVISSLPLANLDTLLQKERLPHLNFNPSTTVTVYNFVFPCVPGDLHPAGFGYLVPRPAEGYDNGGSEAGILGVVFDSCALAAQDQAGRKPITKLTAMVGGPYPDGDEISVDAVLDEVFRQLKRARIEPVHVGVRRQSKCIPTPLVGHLERMQELERRLEDAPWRGRLSVIGAGVHGAGIADCVRGARDVAFKL